MLATNPNLGMATGFDANFGIRVTNGRPLLVSHIGFETEEIVVIVDDHYNINSGRNVLNKVVITSLGVNKPKREPTFETPNINAKRIYGTRLGANLANTLLI